MVNIAIIGATGIVGSTTLAILEERNFPIDNLHLVASARSAGEVREFRGKNYRVEDIEKFDFTKTQLCFFCTSNAISSAFIPIATAAGNIVIDKSSHYRYDTDVPLIVPEVNSQAVKDYRKKNIIANPNCNTIPVVVALKPIYDAVGISRINIATYQSVSGSGKEGVTELAEQTAHLLNGQPIKSHIYSQQIAFNVLPYIDTFLENGYTKEEMKIVWETQKIFSDETIVVNPTAVRVPVFYGHSAAVHIETKDKITVKQALDLLQKAPGIQLMNDATPVRDAAGKDEVYVGRVREDLSHPFGLNLWVVADNVRKGAALNGVQIAEKLIQCASHLA